MITLQLCQTNSIGSRFAPPRVVQVWQVATEAEAEAAIAEARPNGMHVRRQPEDRTGN